MPHLDVRKKEHERNPHLVDDQEVSSRSGLDVDSRINSESGGHTDYRTTRLPEMVVWLYLYDHGLFCDRRFYIWGRQSLRRPLFLGKIPLFDYLALRDTLRCHSWLVCDSSSYRDSPNGDW